MITTPSFSSTRLTKPISMIALTSILYPGERKTRRARRGLLVKFRTRLSKVMGRADSERGSPRRRFRSTWRHQRALHLGGNAAWPNELANLRLDAAHIKRRYNSR